MLKYVMQQPAAASEPAGSPGPHTFSKIQENNFLYFNKKTLLRHS
jgi:hypothetical protein